VARLLAVDHLIHQACENSATQLHCIQTDSQSSNILPPDDQRGDLAWIAVLVDPLRLPSPARLPARAGPAAFG
jgi:hypothetical protein